jgi:hypothetical protein
MDEFYKPPKGLTERVARRVRFEEFLEQRDAVGNPLVLEQWQAIFETCRLTAFRAFIRVLVLQQVMWGDLPEMDEYAINQYVNALYDVIV